MIPGWGPAFEQMPIDDSELTRVEAIIQSMTPGERLKPEIIEAGRRRRIALGSGTAPHEVAGLVKQFRQMRGMMKGLADGSLSRVGIGVQDVPGLMARGPVKVKQRSKRLKGKRKKRR
jgi:signal recognition particle subunit SRP54